MGIIRKEHKKFTTLIPGAPGRSQRFRIISPAIVGEQVSLSWDHNADQGAAFYDLALDLDGVPFTSGVALHNGYLLMPDVINFHTAKQLTLQNLPPGNYEWRVQAFDHAHRASGFSEPGSFTVVEAPTALALNVLAYNKVELTWQYAGTATGFAILRRSTNSPLAEIGTVPGNTLIFVDPAVPPNEHVEYVVKAVSNGQLFRAQCYRCVLFSAI